MDEVLSAVCVCVCVLVVRQSTRDVVCAILWLEMLRLKYFHIWMTIIYIYIWLIYLSNMKWLY